MTAQLATIRWHPSFIPITGLGDAESATEQQQPSYTEIQTYLEDVPEADRWAVHSFTCTDQGWDIAASFSRGDAWSISDRSFQFEMGTSGFTLTGNDGTTAAVGVNVAPGKTRDQSAYRSKLVGISGMVAVIGAICSIHAVQ